MSDFGRTPPDRRQRADSAPLPARSPGIARAAPVSPAHLPALRQAETRLLYENANASAAISVVVAGLLAYAQWEVIPHLVAGAWLAFMWGVSIVRFVLANRYRRSSSRNPSQRWHALFVIGTALAAIGWGAGGIALYPANSPRHEVLVVFVIGGVMLGSASLLAARPEAFLTFLLPTGLLTSWRVASQADEQHQIMGFLGVVFTLATIFTTWRFYRAIESSFRLRFANEDLIESLRKAKDHSDALNRELELRVDDRTAKLLEADQRKDEFLATLAHELRNPLAPIRFALETLKVGAPQATATHAREVIERQVGQLVRLVDDLLDVSRITANKIQLRREPLDLAQLMTTAVESIAPLATAAGQTLEVQSPQPAICVEGDSARLVQVFANVLNNAVKFTPRDGHIWFTVERQSDTAILRIRDTGVGIAPEVLPQVFDMFHQAEHALERSSGGLGIGLTLARRLLKMHDGTIEVRSPGTGEGTEVEIRLPISTAQVAPAIADEVPPLAATHRLRVLIVEDNVDAAEMMEMTIALLGHVTAMAHDGATALTVADEFAPDLIFLDVGLPVINGYEVARTLRARPQFRNVYIAAVTGWGQDEDLRKAREAGCDAHFTKPLSPATMEELLARIANRELDDRRGDTTPSSSGRFMADL